MHTLIGVCDRLRDRLLLNLLKGKGLRIGEALGSRHEDLDARRRLVAVRPRLNENRHGRRRGPGRLPPTPS